MKKIVMILSLIGFNYCSGAYESEDILHAIKNNNISYFEKAVKDKSFNPNQLLEEKKGLPALFYAIHHDREKIFNLLLQCKNIDVNYKTSFGSFPLMFACLYKANYKENRDYYVKKLLNHKDINVNKLDQTGLSAFFNVIIDKELHSLVPLFLNHPDIDLEMEDKDGGTPYDMTRSLAVRKNDNAYNNVAVAILNAQIKLKNQKKYFKK